MSFFASMKFSLLSVFALLCLMLVVSNASMPNDNYLRSKVPNTPMPRKFGNRQQPAEIRGQDAFWDMGFEERKIEYGSDGEQEKSLLNDFQPKPNLFPYFGYHNSRNDEQEKALLNDFQPKPNLFPYIGYHNGRNDEQEKALLNDFQPKPNLFPYFGYHNGRNDEQEKALLNDFQPKPNLFPYFGYHNGRNDEQEKPLLNDFQPKPNLFPYFGYHNGRNDEQEKALLNDFQPKPNLFPYFGYHNGRNDEQEKALLNDFQPKPNIFPYFGYRNGRNDEQEKSFRSDGMDGNSPFIVFFRRNDLKVNNKLPISLPPLNNDHSAKDPPLLPREQAESYPFSSHKFPHILRLFSISPHSPQAKAMEEAITLCEGKSLTGETKLCATSYEAMLDFVGSTFGLDTKRFKAITSSHLTRSKNKVQNYTVVQEPQEILAPKLVGCHPMSYPYTIFYCHSATNTKGFKVSLVGDNGDMIEAIAVCHFDTSEWSRDHPAFRELGAEPGSTDVCHFFPADHMVWFPSDA
ncbi:BURP domain-containing protein 9-like isoform X2 [Mercurialis annua]|uniref:BURP domain-containing protein 9-like isoform X2 n=1 Tax=Mercurialis annua TaxID=3986 RepID=UPI00215FA7C0|nr:BURP domain-containing protein 9-like isoform X2 [Mercurialis annua]